MIVGYTDVNSIWRLNNNVRANISYRLWISIMMIEEYVSMHEHIRLWIWKIMTLISISDSIHVCILKVASCYGNYRAQFNRFAPPWISTSGSEMIINFLPWHNTVYSGKYEATCYSMSQDPTVPWQRSFFPDAVKCWNSLPPDSTSCTSLPVFKKSLCGHDFVILFSVLYFYLWLHTCIS